MGARAEETLLLNKPELSDIVEGNTQFIRAHSPQLTSILMHDGDEFHLLRDNNEARQFPWEGWVWFRATVVGREDRQRLPISRYRRRWDKIVSCSSWWGEESAGRQVQSTMERSGRRRRVTGSQSLIS
ncbi:hypothetical protein AVEN_96953-1 [Araneus ventricosus]|uniref:Uncharacterized protein n=1 Tax=Araneus ventricosus TaxID=182803 RepID=A0A4Y2TNB7_ARAVE|nr:hypothetical protein AVEN_96953-1 [Araneus ventricosus]